MTTFPHKGKCNYKRTNHIEKNYIKGLKRAIVDSLYKFFVPGCQ